MRMQKAACEQYLENGKPPERNFTKL